MDKNSKFENNVHLPSCLSIVLGDTGGGQNGKVLAMLHLKS